MTLTLLILFYMLKFAHTSLIQVIFAGQAKFFGKTVLSRLSSTKGCTLGFVMVRVQTPSRLEAAMALVLNLNTQSVRCATIEQYVSLMQQGLQHILHHQRLRLFALQAAEPVLLADHTSGLVLVTQDVHPTAFLRWYAEHPRPLYLNGPGHKANLLPSVDCSGLAAYCLICPLYSMQQQLLGCLLVEHQQSSFSESDLALLQILTQQLATTWCSLTMQAQLNQAIAERTAELEHEIALRTHAGKVQQVLFEISSMAGNAPDRLTLYQQLHQSISSLLMAKNFVIALYNSAKAEITLEYFRDQFDDEPPNKSFPVGQGMTSFVISSRQSQLICPTRLHELVAQGQIQQVLGNTDDLASWMGAPMLMNDRVYGVVIVQSYQADVVYSHSDLELLMYLAQHIASALQRFFQDEELRESKAALARQNAELQQTVASLREAEAELARQEKLAAVGQMAAGLAHQINTPLGFMHCNLELEQHFISQLATHCQPAGLQILQEMQEMQTDTMAGCRQIGRIVRELRQYADQPEDRFTAYRLADAFEHVMHLLALEQQQRLQLPRSMQDLVLFTRPAVFDQVLLAVCQHLCEHWHTPTLFKMAAQRHKQALLLSFRAEIQSKPAVLDIKMATEFLTDSQQLLSLSVAQHQMLKAGGELSWLGSPEECSGFIIQMKAASHNNPDFSI